MSDPFEWSKQYLNTPSPEPGGMLLTIGFIILLVVAFFAWWMFYGSSYNKKKDKHGLYPLAGIDEMSSGLSGKVQLVSKPNGILMAR